MTSTAEAPDARANPVWVTVLMPVYNGERFVATAIESVLAQTHRYFEFLILDDGSTDSTPEILAAYAARDPRIRVVRHANMDQPATLNRGLTLARHDWVAILDHDDICLPERLERQLSTLREQPEARVVGSWAIEINSTGKAIRRRDRGPVTVAEFRAMDAVGLRVPLVHPSVLLHRPSILAVGGYDPAFGPSADTELWTRVARRHPIVVVPEPLILYRIHAASMSMRRLFEQRELLRHIMLRDEVRRRARAVPDLAELRAQLRWYSPARWRDLQQDVFWYFRANTLLSAAERAYLRTAAYALAAAGVSPVNALRLVGRTVIGALGGDGSTGRESGKSYQLVDLELSEPLPPVALGAGQDGVGLIGRWHGRIIGFTMHALAPGSTLGVVQLREIVDRAFTVRILATKLERALEERWADTVPPPPPSLSVAICTHDRALRLERLLGSLEGVRGRSRFRSLEILVVDNAPSDASTAGVVERFPGVRYLREDRAGLNFARNAALHAAGGDLLAYLDDDVVVDREWLAGLHEAWSAAPHAGGFTGLVLPLRLDTPAQIEFEREGGFGRGFERIHHAPVCLENPLHPVGAGVVGAGCNMAFDRALLLELGGFDEALDTGAPLPGGGDLDIFYRVLRAGRTIVYEPRAAVFHEHRETMAQLRRQYWSWGLGFMSYLAKARRADAELRPRHRAMLRWWFGHQAVAFARAVRRFRLHRTRFVLSELRGAVQGVLGEYDRSMRRIARIRRSGT